MFWLVLGVTLAAGACDGARILVLLPFTARSHWIVREPYLQELAARGHQLTVFTMFPQKTPLPNYTDVDVSYFMPSTVNSFNVEKIKELSSTWKTVRLLNNITGFLCDIIKEPAFQNLLKSNEKYDLIITDLFGPDCLPYFAYKFKVPFISFSTTTAIPWASERFGFPDNPSYIPNFLTDLTPQMSLGERVYNTLLLLYTKYWHLRVYSREAQLKAEEAFGEPLPPVHEVVANTSLYFVHSYHALTQSRPFPPNVVEVGGIHIKDRQPLPEDLQAIMDKAKKGVIIMSFGSLVRSSSFPRHIILSFMKVFSKIPQTVIFKYDEDLPEAPPNVITRKWLPQRDIIEHENVVAVIIHGGLASTIEAVYLNKPVIGIPLFGDQFVNIKNIVLRGGGIQLDLDDLSEEKISTAVKEILTNPKYKEGMRRLSQQYRDRPQTALQTAVFWTEYVIRHQGAHHLRPASVGLPFYQYLLLDVIALLLACLAITLLTAYYVIKMVFRLFLAKTSKLDKHKKNK